MQRFCEVDSWTNFFVNVQVMPPAPAILEEMLKDAIENSFRRGYTRFMIESGVRYDHANKSFVTWPRLNENRRLGLVTEVRVEGEQERKFRPASRKLPVLPRHPVSVPCVTIKEGSALFKWDHRVKEEHSNSAVPTSISHAELGRQNQRRERPTFERLRKKEQDETKLLIKNEGKMPRRGDSEDVGVSKCKWRSAEAHERFPVSDTDSAVNKQPLHILARI